VFWIGGSPCAGKSSIARLLAARHGLRHFECDAQLTPPADPDKCGRLARPPEWQAAREIEYYREQFGAVVASLPPDDRVLAEGTDLLPELLAGHGVPVNQAIWIVPTPEFQLRHYARREWVAGYLAECADPVRAFDNWMRRDMLYADHVRTQAAALGATVVIVDGAASLEENAALVERHFGLYGRAPS
jgi:shikimate kinase